MRHSSTSGIQPSIDIPTAQISVHDSQNNLCCVHWKFQTENFRSMKSYGEMSAELVEEKLVDFAR